MSRPDDQTDGSADPRFDQPSPSRKGDHESLDSTAAEDENDNDVTTEDDLPSGG